MSGGTSMVVVVVGGMVVVVVVTLALVVGADPESLGVGLVAPPFFMKTTVT